MLDIVIMKNPLGEWNPEEGDRQTDLALDWNEFDEIQKFIGVSLLPAKQSDGEVWIDYHHRLKEEYFRAASEKGYEMLGRIWFWYDDAIYLSFEVNQLREECLKVKNESQNSDLIVAIEKICVACDDALKTNSGLLFGCD